MVVRSIVKKILEGADIRESLTPSLTDGYKIVLQNVDDDHDDEINSIENFLTSHDATWSVEETGESHGGDYYVRGVLQAIDVYVEYVTFTIKEKEIYAELLKHKQEWDFCTVD